MAKQLELFKERRRRAQIVFGTVRCRRCRRKLLTMASKLAGIGPKCARS